MPEKIAFPGAVRILWRSSLLGKLSVVVTLILLVGAIDYAPRYLRFFKATTAAARVAPLDLPAEMPKLATVAYRDSQESITNRLEETYRQLRDSLVHAGHTWASNLPLGYQGLEILPKIQPFATVNPFDSVRMLIYIDARLDCHCSQDGYFHLIRYSVDPSIFTVSVIRDEQTTWYQYLAKFKPMAQL